MKKQINPTIKAHLIRSAFYLLLLVAVCAIPFALAQSRSRGTTNPGVIKPTLLPNLTSRIPTMPTTQAVRANPDFAPPGMLEKQFSSLPTDGAVAPASGATDAARRWSRIWQRHCFRTVAAALQGPGAPPRLAHRLAIVPVEPPMDSMFTSTVVVIPVAVTITISGVGIR